MKVFLIIIFMCSNPIFSREVGNLYDDKEFFKYVDAFYDKNINYALFPGRVTDKGDTESIIKISTENKNAKFFKAGDTVMFKVARLTKKEYCTGYIRDVEPGYFILFVKDFEPCWGDEEYFRRGTQLSFNADILAKRVKDASVYRMVLLKRKRDFMRQMNQINHFVWSYNQEQVNLVSKFDKRIAEIELEKEKALEFLLVKKRDSLHLQKELNYRLDILDRDIEYYRVEKVELLQDRWNMDHYLGLPVGQRPQKEILLKNLHDKHRFN